MNQFKQSVRKLVRARWFPTFTKPILLGLVGSGVVYTLHAVGINVVPGQVEAAAAPLVGFLLTAIAQRDSTSASAGAAHVTVVGHVLSGEPSIGKSIAASLTEQLAAAIDADPSLVQGVAASALERVLHPPVAANPPQQPAAAPASVPEVSPASTLAPHITQ